MQLPRRKFLKVLPAAGILAACGKSSKLRLALNWKPDPEFGGFYAADYAKQGLDVEILPGGSGTPTVQMIGAGSAEFGIIQADELLPLGETLQLLHFAVLEEGDINLTEDGRRFVAAETEERKRLFAAALIAYVPLARMIRQVLDERWNHRASAVRFRDELEDHMSPDYAEDTLRTVIAWGRYAELFSYDEEAEQFSLEDIG